jgi:AmpD protein
MAFSLRDGRVAKARWCPSPNCDARPPGAEVELVVLHCISLPPGEFGGEHIDALFCNRLDPDAHPYFADIAGLRVSAHFLFARDGQLTQFVSCGQRAWHAGVSRYRGRTDCNDFSIGIELEGTDTGGFTEPQYRGLVELLSALLLAYPRLDARSICGHSDIAPGRKTDPGPGFDWQRLRRALGSG